MASSDLVTTVGDGDRRLSLEAIRDKIAAELVESSGRDTAILAKELRAVIAELAALPTGAGGSKVADLTARIARKQAASGL